MILDIICIRTLLVRTTLKRCSPEFATLLARRDTYGKVEIELPAMSLLSYYDGQKKVRSRLACALMWLNGLFAAAVVAYWTGVSLIIEEPFRWATGEGVSPSPSLFEYPYLLLWIVPSAAAVIGWLSIHAKMPALGRFVGIYPLLFLGLMVGWFYLTPPQWH